MKNIYLVRPKGFNIGNDVIFLGVNHFIREAFEEPYNVISLPATGKYEHQRKSGLSSQTVYEINQFGHGVIVGGGNLYENDELEVNPIALEALQRPLMIFSVSRGRVYDRRGVLVPRTDTMASTKVQLLNRYAAISLARDQSTHGFLQNLGCNAELAGCPTLFINEIPQHVVPVLEAQRTDCLISIRTPTLMSIPVERQYQLRRQIEDLVALLRRRGYSTIRFLCHDHRDIPFAASFEGVGYLYTEDVYLYLTWLRHTRLNVTFRLHSFLPCLAYDVPAIKISYDERAVSMLETIGMDTWNVNLMRDDLLGEVDRRVTSLGDLATLVHRRRADHWPTLRETMRAATERFVSLVSAQEGTYA
jgi:polysaccharide pyruvyl transferase WcaK-like protein